MQYQAVDSATVSVPRHKPMKAMKGVATSKHVWSERHMKFGTTVYIKLDGKGLDERWTLYEKFKSEAHKNQGRQLLQSVFSSYDLSDHDIDKKELGKNVMIEIGEAYVNHQVVKEHLPEYRDRMLAEKGYTQRPMSHTGRRPPSHTNKRPSTNENDATSPTPTKIARRPSGARVSAASAEKLQRELRRHTSD